MDCELVVPEFGEKEERVQGEALGSSHSDVKLSQDAVFELLGSQLSLRSPSSGNFCQLFRKKPPSGKRISESSLRTSTNSNIHGFNNHLKQPVVPSLCEGLAQHKSAEDNDPWISVSKRRKTCLNHSAVSDSKENPILETSKILPFCAPSPSSRYKSPLRRGDWPEYWESARSLGASSVDPHNSESVVSRVKHMISMVVQRSTCLSLATLDKWLTLLCDFIEFNADEFILFLIMLKKYLFSNGQLRSLYDNVRPQKWERVLAVCAYFVVFLSEEFTGRIRRDLEDLMGPAFHFGREEAAFLSVIDWKVNVTREEFATVHSLLLLEDKEYKLQVWQWLGFHLSELDSSGELLPSAALSNTKKTIALMQRLKDRYPEEKMHSNEGLAQGNKVPKIETSDVDCFSIKESTSDKLISCETEEYQRVPC